jgi:hypothetical protein
MAHGENTAEHEGRKVHREKFEMPEPAGRTALGNPGYEAHKLRAAEDVWRANSEAGHDPGPYPVKYTPPRRF